jgi:hypothetical protein
LRVGRGLTLPWGITGAQRKCARLHINYT